MTDPQQHIESSSRDGGRKTSAHHHELSPLLVGQVSTVSEEARRSHVDDHEQPQPQQQQQRGRADLTRTVVNLMKACLGTGCLALPYACQQGGILVYMAMLLAVAAWCVSSVQRLVLCLHYLPSSADDYYSAHGSDDNNDNNEQEQAIIADENLHKSHEPSSSSSSAKYGHNIKVTNNNTATATTAPPVAQPPPDCTSTLGKVAWHAFGTFGLEFIDCMMVVCLMGILVSYLVAILGFLEDTFLRFAGRLLNAIVIASVMFFLSLVPDLGYLSRASLVGLVLLAATFVVIAGYGVFGYHNPDVSVDFDDATANSTATTTTTTSSLALWPASETGFSRLYGVCIFGYGFVPLTYNFRESMRQPERLVSATVCALSGVTCVNAVLGIGLYMLFPTVSDEILHELPSTGILPTATRLGMAVCAAMTAPLLIVPMGELLEGKWQVVEDDNDGHAGHCWKVRFGICLVSVVIAILFPSFVHVLSFVGCAFVGLVSFCIPPILLLRLRYLKHATTTTTRISTFSSFWNNYGMDAIMAVAGLVATIAGTIFVVSDSSS